MGLFSRKTKTNSAPAFPPVDPVDDALPDDQWLAKSEGRYNRLVENCWGSCETVGRGGQDRLEHRDFGTALFFFQKSIDMLHTNYIFADMKSRRPSAADAWIVDGYTSALAASLSQHPNAPVRDSVREVTHRLRTITSTCERVGLPPNLYREGLAQIALSAPAVNVDDIFW
jgi:hypothetical protein